jgi:hypothetical protein
MSHGVGKKWALLPFHALAAAALLTVIILGSLQPDKRYQAFGYLLIPRAGNEIDIRPLFGVYSPSVVRTYDYGAIIGPSLVYLVCWYFVSLGIAIVGQRKNPPLRGGVLTVWGLSRPVWLFVMIAFGLIALGELPYTLRRPGDVAVFLAFAAVAALGLVNVIRTTSFPSRIPPGYCQKCGYDLRATPDRCPECGTVRGKAEGHTGKG